jgi:3-hydroxybutyryl-CoA dehydrogenase
MDIAMKWVESIGKKGVRMEKECPGFIGNRLQLALLREAMYIVEKGWAKPEEVDKAIEYGHGRRLPVTGPLCSADLGGLDIFDNVASYLFKDLCDYKETPKIIHEKVESGQLGK